VPTNVCSWGKSGRAANITAKTGFDPELTSATPCFARGRESRQFAMI
jgi:hypothetical protein